MRTRTGWGAAAVVCGLLVSGCGGGGDGADGSAGDGAAAGFPVRVTDCEGNATSFAAAPKKIVTSNAAALELLLRLGAGDRVAGTGFPPGKGTLPGALGKRADDVKVLSRSVIPKEKLLGSGADLYIDSFASMGGMGGGMGDAPTPEEYKAVGMKHIYLKSTACAQDREGPVTDLSAVERDITALGAVTGNRSTAAELVDGMRTKLASVRTAVRGVPERKRPTYFFFDYDAGTKAPTAVCNRQIAHAVITLAGARNVFASCDGAFKQVGWEDVVSKNPDWIQLGVRNRGSAAANEKAFDEARKWLESNPATKGLRAVKKGRFLRIGSEATTIAGVSNADTVVRIAKALHPGKVR
ncbi:ABC transporter substrate-binding protein [Streptomyces spectabilis]|uniref:Iron complex transport system substrate-binding protein n=1 Tax=Streptomyces spectabilis TaxID=68270 RepID=A0A7W8AU08_STRST|nr:ABC transporter substrate-binding protein [Streptomyces spectabilis]MBB5103208.1 iron complex transport system substrate-binding protein [Streptomyces spectabilis]MCI3902401.1 ABC transporter substrate-binding protein [Streptomyces spectabilis]GGV14075.1 ABC transporter substrate-binding protein [Streptomyces spectabilis]